MSWTDVPETGRFQLMPLGDGLYDGNCGIALFFAALAKVRGKTRYRDLALQAIQPVTWEGGIGGGTGLGSMIYSFARISEWLAVPQLAEQARQMASRIAPEAIAADRKFDIIGGVAGAILGLLALTEPPLPTLLACAQHLLNHCQEVYAERSLHSQGAIGFSHGAAGIAYVLLRLYGVTQDKVYLEMARKTIAYEDRAFSLAAGNWREVTPIDQSPVFWSTWCHGAPGIALRRLGGLAIDASERVLIDLEIALKTTRNEGLQAIDPPCCGNLGRAEVMLVAAEKLQDPQWEQASQALVARVVQRARQTGHYQLFGELPIDVFIPTFFQGAAGVGYQLLRSAVGQHLPSVLLWE
jgi:type 2 lantibiotic biosynthesis protein LanM